MNKFHGGSAFTSAEYEITPMSLHKGKYDLILEIKSNGRLNTVFVPITLIV